MNGNQDRSREGPVVEHLIPMAGDGRLSASPSRLATPVRGLLLDMCNVLYDDTVWRRWVLQLLGHLGYRRATVVSFTSGIATSSATSIGVSGVSVTRSRRFFDRWGFRTDRSTRSKRPV